MPVALITLSAVDYFQTVHLEVKYVWNTPRSLTKTVFFLARYAVLVTGTMSVVSATVNMSPRNCQFMFSISCYSILLMVLLVEAILFIRIYAIAGRKKWVLIYLASHFTVLQVAKFVLMAKSLNTIGFIRSPAQRAINCAPDLRNFALVRALLSATYGLSAASEVVIFFIMAWFAVHKFRRCGSDLYKIFIRDGVVYFVCLTAMSIANMLITILAAPVINLIFANIQSVTSVILSTRMILHLRQASQAELVMSNSKPPPIQNSKSSSGLGSLRGSPNAVVDYLQTVHLEVKYIWNTPRSLTKTVFLLARYAVFVTGTMNVVSVTVNMSPRSCHIMFSISCYSILIMVFLVEAILFIRIYAIAGRKRWMLIYLISHFTVLHVTKCVLMAKSLNITGFMRSPAQRAINCAPNLNNFAVVRALWSAIYGLSAASEVVIFLIMCWFAVYKFSRCGSDLYTVLIRDGVIYFVCLTGMSIANVLMTVLAAPVINLIFSCIQSVTSVLLATRMILHLRQASQAELIPNNSKPPTQKSKSASGGPIRFGNWLNSEEESRVGSDQGRLEGMPCAGGQ
ncbi:hypothetical protein FA15DRAFT_710499 [Coprinopsis marcescibilis]|uniref:DUF6533 domain-containing protein n=1 Tax=Coprinopsis marcescibilis TaxID=230819 RepID=A0A5C3KD32_COPMA|nr:hypothetical protein FA15DRAFT_710499 [Coprinopsis marcescibilis]